jgi:hypothetical protein
MGAVTDARQALADAVTAAGIDCTPWPPDALAPPAAFVDSVNIDYSTGNGFSFCANGLAVAQVTTCGQRNDKAGATQYLEDLIPKIIENIDGIDGVRVTGVDSGSANIAGADLPAVVYQIEFGITSS